MQNANDRGTVANIGTQAHSREKRAQDNDDSLEWKADLRHRVAVASSSCRPHS